MSIEGPVVDELHAVPTYEMLKDTEQEQEQGQDQWFRCLWNGG